MPTIMTADETKNWLRSMGLKPIPRLPKGSRVLYVAQPGPGFVWKVEPFGSGFSVGVYDPTPEHAFTGMTFRLNIDLDTLVDTHRELATLLREIADRVERTDKDGNLPGGGWIAHYQTIFDSKKNDIGRFAIKPTGER